jgi:hypothetical protein
MTAPPSAVTAKEENSTALIIKEYERSSEFCNHVDNVRNVITSFFLTLVAGAIGGVTSASAPPGSRCLNLGFAVRPGLCPRPSSSPRRRPVWRLSRCRSPTCRPCTRRSTEGNRGGAAERASGRLGPYRNGRGQRSPHLESRAFIAPRHPYPNPDRHGSPRPASAAAGAAANATSAAATTGGRLMAGGGGSRSEPRRDLGVVGEAPVVRRDG